MEVGGVGGRGWPLGRGSGCPWGEGDRPGSWAARAEEALRALPRCPRRTQGPGPGHSKAFNIPSQGFGLVLAAAVASVAWCKEREL